MTPQQKLELGIEIVSAMQASAYNTDIEEGRILALMDTELDRLGTHTLEEFKLLDADLQNRIISFVESQRKRLHEQALFVADVVIEKIKSLNL